jgi:metal-sulfur cluster biosynthetic enzyme
MTTRDDVFEALRHVADPEIGINIVDLGLVYAVDVRDGRVRVTMTTTAPACPLGETLSREVSAAIRRHFADVTSVSVDLVSEPLWQPSMMSDAAHAQLGWGPRR